MDPMTLNFVKPSLDLLKFIWNYFKERTGPEEKLKYLKKKDELQPKFNDYLLLSYSKRIETPILLRDNKNNSREYLGDSCGKYFLVGLYDRGLLVGLPPNPIGLKKDNGKIGWRTLQPNEMDHDLAACLVGKIPYEIIMHVDWDGDENYPFPHVYCVPKRRAMFKCKSMFSELNYCKEYCLPGALLPFYKEVVPYDAIHKKNYFYNFMCRLHRIGNHFVTHLLALRRPSRLERDYLCFHEEEEEIASINEINKNGECPLPSQRQALDKVRNNDEENKKYGSFIVYDFNNGRIIKDYPITPNNFRNYYTKNDLPYETSPVFFEPEVLDKYKNNPEKYTLSERSISCRDGWRLRTYDINESNQVHTYAVYLADLPYKEQLHWQQYNVEPKGSISQRAIKTDFEGSPWPEISAKERLKVALQQLEKVTFESSYIWSPREGGIENVLKRLHLVNTQNINEWQDFILSLTNATIEGFNVQTLREILKNIVGEKTQDIKELKSLGLIKEIIKSVGNEVEIKSIHVELQKLQSFRSKGKAHGRWETPEGCLISNSKETLDKVTQALEKLNEVFERI